MRPSAVRLYAPFLALVVVQALVIAIAPSTSPGRPQVDDRPAVTEAGERPPADDDPLGAEDALNGDGPPTGDGLDGPDGTDPADRATTAGEAGPGPPPTTTEGGGAEPGGEVRAAGDTSHCTDDGRQHGFFYQAPPCVPKWQDGADNGAATYRGVTADTVKVVHFRERRNEQVTTILSQEGLRPTRAQEQAFAAAAETFLNDNYEFYGREVELVFYYAEQCQETPATVPECRQEAREVIRQHDPFMIIWDVPLYPDVFDEWARERIVSVGGWHFDRRYYTERRPYRWDVFMDGTTTAEFIGEYYCKKLANKNATHAGHVIHPSFPNGGDREQVPRRAGILAPDTDAQFGPALRAKAIIDECDAFEAVTIGYDQDIERGTQQAQPITERLIREQVTTVIYIGDPIAPIFRANNQTRNNYFPEMMLAGSGLIDYDKLGRLYDPQQWAHAFGPSHLGLQLPLSHNEATRMWRYAGNSGNACGACNLAANYYLLAGTMIQMAGPDLTPHNLERGMFGLSDRGGWQETGGDPHYALVRWGPGNYTGVNDIREVYWDANATSSIDGRPGAYVPMNGGRRYAPGQVPTQFDIPQSAR